MKRQLETHAREYLLWFVIVLTSLAVYLFINPFYLWDWMNAYRPASIQFFTNGRLYPVLMSAPPWAVIPYLPLAPFSIYLGGAFLFAANIIIILGVTRKLGGSWLAAAAVLFSYPAFRVVLHGQIDAIVSLGFILPPVWGLFFLVMKPQISAAYIFYLAYATWKDGGLRKMAATFTPVCAMMAVGIAIYGPFWSTWGDRIAGKEYNVSLWPVSIPIGFYLLVKAIEKRNRNNAIIASNFLSPYFVYYSWIVPIFGIVGQSKDWLVVAVSLLSWVVKVLAGWP